MGCFYFTCGLKYAGMQQIPTIQVSARTIRHYKDVDPLRLIKTKEDLISFPSVECTLHTTNQDTSFENCTFVILISEKDDEMYYVIYLGKDEDKSRKCLGYDPLKVWDVDAKLIRH